MPKRTAVVEEVEELDALEDLDDLEEDSDLEEISDDEDVEDLDDAEEEEEEPTPRKKAKPAKSRTVVDTDDPKSIIQTVLVDGLLAYMDQYMDTKFEERFGGEEAPAAPRKKTSTVQKATAKPAQRKAKPAPAAKRTGKTATLAQVRRWLQKRNYEVADRGRIASELKNEFMKKTGYGIAD